MEEWPSDLAFLQELEEPMKCPICFDLMKAPVMLPSCEHNYCSLCIRRYFCQREQCPTCGSPASSNQLRPNGIMEKTIQQFKKIRSPLRSLCLNKLPQTQTQMQSGCHSNKQALLEDRDTPRSKRLTRSRKSEDAGSGQGTGSTSRKRPASQSGSDSEDSDVQILSEDENCSFSSSQLSSSASSLQTGSSRKPRNVQSKLFVPGDGSKTRAREHSRGEREWAAGTASSSREASPSVVSPLAGLRGSVSSSNTATAAGSSPTELSPWMMSSNKGGLHRGSPSPGGGVSEVVEKVPCPVCGVPVVTSSVNRHLDLCLGRQQTQTIQKERKKPLSKLVYNLLSDKDIRKRLKDLGLASKGDRQALIKRHHEFTLYHNADCDSIAPKDMNGLVKEFEESQKVQVKLLSKSPTSSQSILRFTKDSKPDDIEKAQQEYAAQHKDQFQSLIRDAKQRMKSARKPPPASACSAASGPHSGAGDGVHGHTSDSAVDEDRTTDADDVVAIDCDMVCTTEVDEPDGELVCAAEVRTTSEAKKLKNCVPESDEDDDGVRNEETHQEEISGSETTTETVLSKTRRSSAINSNSDALSDDVVNKEVCKDTVGLPSQLKIASTKSQGESAAAVTDMFWEVAGLGEENSSDAFECDLKSKSVLAKTSVRGRGKRALRSAKPSWQETEATGLSVSPDSSQTSNRSQGKRRKPNPNQTFQSNSPEKTLSSDSCLSNSIDESFQGSSHTAEPQSFSAEAESEKTILPQKCSPTQFPRSHSKPTVTGTDSMNDSSLRESAHTVTGTDSVNDSSLRESAHSVTGTDSVNDSSLRESTHSVTGTDSVNDSSLRESAHSVTGTDSVNDSSLRESTHSVTGTDSVNDTSLRESAEPSDECPANADRKAMNAQPAASESSSIGQIDSDHPQNTVKQSDPEVAGELTHMLHQSRASRARSPRTRGKGSKGAKYLESEKDTCVTGVHALALPCEDEEDQNSEGVISSAGEVSRLNDLQTDSSQLSETEDKSYSKKCDATHLPGTSGVQVLKNTTECFELNLSDCEDDELFSAENEAESTSSRSSALPQNGQVQELNSACEAIPKSISRTAHETNLSHCRRGDTENFGETNPSPIVLEMDQETESESEYFRTTKLKSLLKQKCTNEAMLKKSVRFAGLRARLSDIQRAECDRKKVKEKTDDLTRGKGHARLFADVAVSRDEATFLAHLGKAGRHSKSQAGKARCRSKSQAGKARCRSKSPVGKVDSTQSEENIILEAEGDDLSLKAEGDDLSLKAEGDDLSLKAEGDDLSLKAEGDDLSLKAEGDDLSLKAEGDDLSLKAEGDDLSLEAEGEDVSLEAEGDDLSLKAEGDDLSLKAEGDDLSLKAEGDDLSLEAEGEDVSLEGDTRQTVSEPKPNLSPDTSISATEEPRVAEHSLSQNSQEKYAGNVSEESKQRRNKSQPAKSVSHLVTDCRGGIEKPEDVNHPKSRPRRKRTNSSVDRCDQQAEAAETSLQMEMAESAPKRRKTGQSRKKDEDPSLMEMAESAPKRRKASQSRNKDAEPSLLTETVETAPKRRNSIKSQSKDAEPSLLTETVETAPKRRNSIKSQSKDAEPSLLTETVETAPKRRRSQLRFRDVLPTIPEIATDLGQSSELKHQSHGTGILQTIPETSSDCEEPSETEHRNSKRRSSKS